MDNAYKNNSKIVTLCLVNLYIYLSLIFFMLSWFIVYFVTINKVDFIVSTLYFSPVIIIGLTYLFRRRTLRFAYEYENEIKLLGPFMRLFLYIFTTRFFYGTNGNNRTMKAIYVFCFQASLISFYVSFTIRNGHYLSSLFLFGILESVLPMFLEIFIGSKCLMPIAKCETSYDIIGDLTKFISKPALASLLQDGIHRLVDDKQFPIDKRVLTRIFNLLAEYKTSKKMNINGNSSLSIGKAFFTPQNQYIQYGFSILVSSIFTYIFLFADWFNLNKILPPSNSFNNNNAPPVVDNNNSNRNNVNNNNAPPVVDNNNSNRNNVNNNVNNNNAPPVVDNNNSNRNDVNNNSNRNDDKKEDRVTKIKVQSPHVLNEEINVQNIDYSGIDELYNSSDTEIAANTLSVITAEIAVKNANITAIKAIIASSLEIINVEIKKNFNVEKICAGLKNCSTITNLEPPSAKILAKIMKKAHIGLEANRLNFALKKKAIVVVPPKLITEIQAKYALDARNAEVLATIITEIQAKYAFEVKNAEIFIMLIALDTTEKELISAVEKLDIEVVRRGEKLAAQLRATEAKKRTELLAKLKENAIKLQAKLHAEKVQLDGLSKIKAKEHLKIISNIERALIENFDNIQAEIKTNKKKYMDLCRRVENLIKMTHKENTARLKEAVAFNSMRCTNAVKTKIKELMEEQEKEIQEVTNLFLYNIRKKSTEKLSRV